MRLRRWLVGLARRPRLPGRTVRLRLTFLYGSLFLASGAGLLAITYAIVDHQLAGPIRVSPGGMVQHTAAPVRAGTGIVRSPVSAQLQAQHAADLNQLLAGSGIALAMMAAASIILGWLVAGRALQPLRIMTATTRRISERNLHERLALQGPQDELKDLGETIDGLLARLEAAFESQRRFVANASHELRTPLTLGRAMLQVALASPYLTLDSLRLTCQEVIQAGKDQEQLIEALLTLARSQRGLDHREPFDLAELAREVVRSRESDATTRGLSLNTTLSAAPVSGDPRLAKRLVSNLVDNAIRHNVPNGRAEIVVSTRARRAVLRVINSGPRIAADEIERLLQPFQRLDTQRSSGHDGIGLGLSIIAAITDAHDAELSVHPALDGGLDIELIFPGVVQAPGNQEALAKLRSRPGPGHEATEVEQPEAPELTDLRAASPTASSDIRRSDSAFRANSAPARPTGAITLRDSRSWEATSGRLARDIDTAARC
jgi:signal transduction histidine kinase